MRGAQLSGAFHCCHGYPGGATGAAVLTCAWAVASHPPTRCWALWTTRWQLLRAAGARARLTVIHAALAASKVQLARREFNPDAALLDAGRHALARWTAPVLRK